MNDLTLNLPAIAPRFRMSAVFGGERVLRAVDAEIGAVWTRSCPPRRDVRGAGMQTTSDRVMVSGGEF